MNRKILLLASILTLWAPSNILAGDSIAVNTQKIEPSTLISELTMTGEINAEKSLSISFSIGGRATQILVDVGDQVKKGDLLAAVDSYQYEQQKFAASSSLANVEADFEKAKNDYERQKSLFARNATTQSNLNAANDQFIIAKTEFDKAKTALQTAEKSLEDTQVFAPIDGVVTARNIELGQVVGASQTIFTIGNGYEASFDVPEVFMTLEAHPTEVKLSLTEKPEVEFAAVQKQISPLINEQKATVEVLMSIPNPPKSIGYGDAVTALIKVSEADIIALPFAALTSYQSKPAVWLVDPKTSRTFLKHIEIDRHLNEKFVVANGLDTGDLVVTNGAHLLFPNRLVSIKENK